MLGKKGVLLFVLLTFGLLAATFQPTQIVKNATIDFSGLAEGAFISSLSYGVGISGDQFEGSVTVFGFNPDFPGTNTAMIFDATCAGGCSGGDFDLNWPELGSGLIISADLDQDDPDDADNAGAYFDFDFSNLKGTVNAESITVGDVDEEVGEIKVYKNGALVKTVPFPPTGDHIYEVVPVGVDDIDRLVVDLNGSGLIDNIEIVIEEEEQEPEPSITLNVACEPQGQYSEDLRLTGTLKQDGDPVANHAVSLSLPDGNVVSVDTNDDGSYSYLFASARNYIGQNITASATVDGQNTSASRPISESDFEACNPPITITLNMICEPQGTVSNDLRLSGVLKSNGDPQPNQDVELILPNGETISQLTEDDGSYSYLFKGARTYVGQKITAAATIDGQETHAEREIANSDFEGCNPIIIQEPQLTLEAICEIKAGQAESHDLRLTGTLTDDEGSPMPDFNIRLNLPNGNEVTLTTDQEGMYSYLFEGADQFYNQFILAETEALGENISDQHEITPADFEGCQSTPKTYKCHNLFLTTFHGQPIELGSQIPGWGLEDVNLECIGRGQGKSCRLVVKGQPGYLIKSDTLKMNVPRLEPYVEYQAQIKGYDGAWTSTGCEFSFITGGRATSISARLAEEIDQVGWVSFGEEQFNIEPLGACSGLNDACLFAENIIGFHLNDIYGNQLPGSKLSAMQPGDRISINRDHRLYTYEFTGSERVRQSAEGNQAILDAAAEQDLVLTTCSGYWLTDEGHYSHTRLATFKLLDQNERLNHSIAFDNGDSFNANIHGGTSAFEKLHRMGMEVWLPLPPDDSKVLDIFTGEVRLD
jgi:hypothetical protein